MGLRRAYRAVRPAEGAPATRPAEGAPTGKVRPTRSVLLAVDAVFFVHGMLFASWVAHIPQVKDHLGIGLGQLGLALLGAPAGSVIAMVAAGRLVSRLGSRRVVRGVMVGYCLAGSLLGVADSFTTLLLAYLLWGVFQGGLEVAMNTQAVAVEGSLGRPVMPLFHGSWSLGALAGAGLGALSVATGVSLVVQMLVLGALSLAALVPLTARLLADAAPSPATPSPAAPSPAAPSPARHERRDRALRLVLVVLCLVALADMLCEGAAADWSAVYLRSSLHAAKAVSGLGYTVYSLGMVLTRFAGGRLLARWPRRAVIPLLSGVAVAGMAAGLAADVWPVAIVAFGCLGLGCALVVPSTYSAVGVIPGAHPGRGVALVSGVGWLGFVAGPPLIGQLAAATSLRLALVTVPALSAVVAVLVVTTPVFAAAAGTGGRSAGTGGRGAGPSGGVNGRPATPREATY